MGRRAVSAFLPALTLGLLFTAAPRGARAGDLSPDGTFLFDPTATFTYDFEEDDDASGLTTKADAGALSGNRVLVLAPLAGNTVVVPLPKERRTYRVSAWIRDAEANGSVAIGYSDRIDELVALYPTGRVTSDGWVEIANDHIRVDGANATVFEVELFSATEAVADALEVVSDGGDETFPAVANAKCDGVSQVAACAADQTCMWGVCRNVGPWVPPLPPDHDDVAEYLAARVHLLFGPYLERTQDFPAVDVYLDQMRHASDRWTFWSGFTAAVRRLHDGHTQTNSVASYTLTNPKPIGVCFLEGDADLTHQTAPKDADYLDVVVSHVAADHTLGLHAGDRLVSVDGQHPVAWARSILGVNWDQPGISNHSTYAELVSGLRGTISRFAAQIEVIRCDSVQGTCGALEAISITDIPNDPQGTMASQVDCDNRPLRHLASAPKSHATGETVYSGIVNESNATEKIYGLEWESLDTTNGSDGVGTDLKNAVATWTSDARGVILDHRTGFGGTILAPEILWSFSIQKHPNDLYVDRTFSTEEQPAVADAQALFTSALGTQAMQYCGSDSPNVTVPVALLITQDVSASDWLPQGMKGGQKTKLFGPFQTNGGFSTRYSFGYWLSLGYVMAVGDDILADGTTHNGRGVEPDVVVLPKQSDLLAGKDSVYEAALAWVRSEMP